MGRRSLTQALSIWANGERVGVWRLPAHGPDELEYDDSWVDSKHARALSRSLPLVRGAVYKGTAVANYFDNLLPDNTAIRSRIASRFKTESTRSFDLLEAIGRDCVGAVQLLGENDSPSDVREIRGVRLSEQEVETILQQTVGPTRFGGGDDSELRISLAGAQEKTALLWHMGSWQRPLGATPTTHILKLPMGLIGNRKADFTTSVENEWLCLNILREFGVPVPLCAVLRFGSQKVLAVERFDRRLHASGKWLMRLPQEDFCQALGRPSHEKYEADGGPGVVDLADVLFQSVDARADLQTLLTTQLVFWLLASPDGHAKNFSLALLPQSRYRLTPIYDVMSLWPVEGDGAAELSWRDAKMAMALRGKSKHYRMSAIQRRHFNSTAALCHYGADMEDIIVRVLEATQGVVDRMRANLPADFPGQMADRILLGVESSARALARMPAR